MKTSPIATERLKATPRNDQLLESLRNTLGEKYGQIFFCAQKQWQSRFVGDEPSDACVRVRVSSAQTLHAA